jgi:class 3 adenylate cyclase/tetratricopeptide (TPR) repeat protein
MPACPRCGEENPEHARFCLACGRQLDTDHRAQLEVRKTVTVLFCDVSGSTRLGEQQDPEQVRRVMFRYFDRARDVLERHGGTVEKFIGDAVVGIFGIPVLHEDDALRALRAAIDLRAAIEDLNVELEAEFGLRIDIRIGVNSGEVVAGETLSGDGYASGDAVNVAQRLESSAVAGEILIGDTTQRLARDAIRTEPAGPMELKGKEEPVVAHRLLEVLPGQLSHARRFDSPIVGRERELALLRDAFDRSSRERSCHLFTVLGAAGVGKSRLLREALAQVGDDAHVFSGICLAYGEGITFWPVLEVVKQATGIVDGDSSSQAVAKIEAALAGDPSAQLAAQRVASLVGLVETPAAAEEGFWAFRKLLEALARDRPLVVVIDDAHWGEAKLLELLDHVADSVRDAPLLLVCLARPDLLEAWPAWGGGKRNATSIFLEPLSEAESRLLLSNLLGGGVADEVLARIHPSAEGNPLFVEEMVSMLIDGGYLEPGGWAAGADVSEIPVPESIQVLLASRLDQLDGGERRAIERGAVEGSVFHRGAVEALADDELEGHVDECLDSLVRKELVRPYRASFAGEDGFRFRHGLIREAAYDALPKVVRADLHERVAVWLEDMVRSERAGEVEELLGFHLEQAYRYRVELTRMDERARAIAQRAAARLGAAGRRALAKGDLGAATNLLDRALALVGEKAETWLDLAVELGIALREAGDFRRAQRILAEALEVARRLGDRRAEVVVVVQRAEATVLSDPSRAEEVMNEVEAAMPVLEEVGDDRALATAWTLLGQYRGIGLGRFAYAEEAYGKALEHVGKIGDGREKANVLRGLAVVYLFGPRPVEDAMTRCRGLIDLAGGDPMVEASVLRSLGALEARLGNFDEGRALVRRARMLYEELGVGGMLPVSLAFALGDIELLAEDYPAAERELRRGEEVLERMGERGYRSTVLAMLARAVYGQGRLDEAETLAREGQADSPESDIWASLGAGALALVQASRGEYERAEATARETIVQLETTDTIEMRAVIHADLAEVLVAAGRDEDALRTAEQALDLFEQKGNVASAARVRRLFPAATAPGRAAPTP